MTVKALPKVLYKYYKPERIDTLEKGTIRFSRPADFNDTFDCYYLVPRGDKNARDARREYLDTLGVFCMSETCDNPVMWAHYAAQQKGFVVGYDTADTVFSARRGLIRSIDYRDGRMRVLDPTHSPFDTAWSKLKAWSYEEEWRCVRTFEKTESRDVVAGDALIKEIIIGTYAEDHFVSRLLEYVTIAKDSGGYNINVYDSVVVQKKRRFEHHLTTRRFCPHCKGRGHVTGIGIATTA